MSINILHINIANFAWFTRGLNIPRYKGFLQCLSSNIQVVIDDWLHSTKIITHYTTTWVQLIFQAYLIAYMLFPFHPCYIPIRSLLYPHAFSNNIFIMLWKIFMISPPAAGATRSADGFRLALPSGNYPAKCTSGDGWTVPLRLAAGGVSQTSRWSPWGLLAGNSRMCSEGFSFYIWGSGGWPMFAWPCFWRPQAVATVRNRLQPSVCDRRGLKVAVHMRKVAKTWLFGRVRRCGHVVLRGRCGFVTFQHVSRRVSSRFVWQAQYFCYIFRRCVAFFVAGAALWTPPMSFCVAGAALYTCRVACSLRMALSALHEVVTRCKFRGTTRSTLYTPHSTFLTLHSTLHTLNSTFYTLHSTL